MSTSCQSDTTISSPDDYCNARAVSGKCLCQKGQKRHDTKCWVFQENGTVLMSSLREMESQCSWCVRSTFQCKTNITFRHRYQTSWQKYDNLQEQVRILLQKSLSNKAILGVCLCSAVVSVVQFQNTCDQAFCAFVQPLVSVKCFDSESEKTETIRCN